MMPHYKSQHQHITTYQSIHKELLAINDMKEESTLLTHLGPEKILEEESPYFTPLDSPPESPPEIDYDLPPITIYRKHYYNGHQLTEIYDTQNKTPTVRSKGTISYVMSQFNQISQMGSYIINTSTLGNDNLYNCSEWKELSPLINKCYCTKSSCEQNYCSCYIANKRCNSDCFCQNCRNMQMTMKQIGTIKLDRHKEERVQDLRCQKKKERIRKPKKKRFHTRIKGCKCKKAGSCLKSYCSCHRLGINCGSECNCLDCKN